MINPILKGQKVRIAIMAILLAAACFLTYYFHVLVGTGTVFTHFFYIPIILASLWWKRKGLLVAIFLAVVLILSHICFRVDVPTVNDYFRAVMFVVISFVVAMLSEQITKAREELQRAHNELERQVEERTAELAKANEELQIEITEHKRAEELYQTLATNSPVGVYIVQEGKFQFVNPKFQKLSGFTEDELLDMDPLSIVHPEDRERVRENAVGMLKGNRFPPYEFRTIIKGGETKWRMETVTSIRYRGKRAALGNYTDITEHKQAEEALRESEERYRALVSLGAEVGEAVIMMQDTEQGEGIQTFVSSEWPRITGYSKKELLGMSFFDLLHPKHREASLERHRRKMRGEVVSGLFEISIIRKDGTEVPIELTSAYTTYQEKHANVAYVRDITERKRAEEALRESENRYRALVEANPHGIQEIDASGIITYTNPTYQKMIRYTEKELLGKSILDLVEPASRRDELREYLSMLVKEKPRPTTYLQKNRTKDGQLIDMEVDWNYNRDSEGRVVGFTSVITDITERKRAEEALKESEDKYRSLLDLGARVGEAVIMLQDTEQGTAIQTFVSDQWPLITGYSREELLGMPFYDLVHPKYHEVSKERYRRKKQGEVMPGLFEMSIIRKDGTEVPIELTSASTMYRGKEANVAYIRDITERKQAEEKIKHAAEAWRTTFDSITDLVSICDNDFKLVRVNKAFAGAFKMKPAELIGKSCYEIVHGTNEPISNCPHKVTIETKKPATAEFFEPHLGMHLEMSTSPIFNENGEVVASVHLMRDITERKKIEEQLIVTDRLASIGELSSGIAHELNNPLTAVIGFSQLLLDKDIPDDVKEDLKIIHSEAQRTAQVVNGLLTFARKHTPVKQLVNINSIIEKVLELRAYEQKVSNIQVNTHFASDLPEITADYFQLQQVFLNIVINAEHFMIEANNRGTLTITTERIGGIIRASFADDGPGISKENMGHLFDPFFTTKEVGKGTGLGLSICHGIVTEHGGRLYAESKLGKGATFVVELPVKIAD